MKKFIDIKNCIYSIENNINKKKYIGQTIDLEVRINNHYTNIFKKTNNILLMNDIDKYGIENFTFSILEILNKELLPKKESLSLYLHYSKNIIWINIKLVLLFMEIMLGIILVMQIN
jgi:group I intron endonuclease